MEGPSHGGSELTGSSDDRRFGSASTMMTKEEVRLIVISTLGEVTMPIIGNMARTVVREEIQIALQKFRPDKDWNNELSITASAERSLEIKILDEVSLPVLTGEELNGKGGAIRLAIFDMKTGKLVASGPEASSKIEILILQANHHEDELNWSIEDFNRRIIIGSNEGKPYFSKKVFVYLERGMGILSNVKLGHGSTWVKDCLCRLGARVVENFSGITVKDAWTESFMVRDRRIANDKKKEIPSLSDKIWRLRNIQRGGKIDKCLQREKIYTVEDLLIRLLKDYDGLKNIVHLGEKKWEDMVKHARACPSGRRMYCYNNSLQNTAIVFNIHGEIRGLYPERQYATAHMLSQKNKDIAGRLFSSAIVHWEDVVQFDDDSLLQQHLSSSRTSVNQSDSIEPRYSVGLHNILASEMIGVCSDTSLQGIISNMASTQESDMGRIDIPSSTGTEGADFMSTEPFVARKHHGELYKKHHPPSVVDEVWLLENIGKDGAFHQHLRMENVNSVQDFLILHFSDPVKLRNILGVGMSAKEWEATLEHAQTCTFDRKLYYYDSSRSQHKNGVVFNMVGQVMGMISNGQYLLADKLSESEKDDAREMVISAFRNRDNILPFDDASTSTSSYLSVVQSMNFPSEGGDLSSPKIGENTFSQPNAASPDCMQSIYSMGGVHDQSFSFPSPATDSLPCGMEPFWNDHLQFSEIDCSSGNAFVPGSVIPFIGAKWGWKELHVILLFCFSLKRIVARKKRIVARKTRVEEISVYC